MSRIKEWLGSDSSFEDADTSGPWFVRHEQIMDVALVLASVAAVALAVMAIFLWGWV